MQSSAQWMCQRHQPASDKADGSLMPEVHIAISSSHVALPQAANALGMALPAPKTSAQEEEAPAGLTAASKANLHPQAMDAGVGYSEADINRYEQDGCKSHAVIPHVIPDTMSLCLCLCLLGIEKHT